MFYTSRRVSGEEAFAWGLADVLVPQADVRAAALKLAAEIAENSPLGLVSTRATMRGDIADRVLQRDRARIERADAAAQDRGFQGRRQGDGGAARAEFFRALNHISAHSRASGGPEPQIAGLRCWPLGSRLRGDERIHLSVAW